MNCFKCYYNQENLTNTYLNLILFGLETFKDALIIQRLEDYKEGLNDVEEGKLSNVDFFNKFIYSQIFQNLIDVIKICIFFENYMKSQLLRNGFLLHKIDYNKLKDLSKEQQNRPIHIKELKQVKDFVYDSEKKVACHEFLKIESIYFSILINKSEYLKIIKLPEDIVSFLKELNVERNKLHLNENIEFTISKGRLHKIELLDDFANEVFDEIKPYIKP